MKIGHEFQQKNEITVFDFQPEKETFFMCLHCHAGQLWENTVFRKKRFFLSAEWRRL